jgi:hypothetical protein
VTPCGTNDDKRRTVLTLLNDEEWSVWSDRDIARKCGVTHSFVSKLRDPLVTVTSDDRTYTTKHGTTATVNTAAIGRAAARGVTVASRYRDGRPPDHRALAGRPDRWITQREARWSSMKETQLSATAFPRARLRQGEEPKKAPPRRARYRAAPTPQSGFGQSIGR